MTRKWEIAAEKCIARRASANRGGWGTECPRTGTWWDTGASDRGQERGGAARSGFAGGIGIGISGIVRIFAVAFVLHFDRGIERLQALAEDFGADGVALVG